MLGEADFRKQIAKAPAAGYLFFGDEDYLKASSQKLAEAAICADPTLAPFNCIRLDGLELTPDLLVGAMSTLPMMSERKLIEVNGVNFRDMKQSLIDDYCTVLDMLEEYDFNTVIISVPSGGIDEGYLPKKPSACLKKLASRLIPVNFAKSTPLMLARWAARHFTANGVRADQEVCSMLVEHCGNDMYRLSTEIDKISWYALATGREFAEPEDIKKAAIADTSYDSFAFANAIMNGDRVAALSVLSEMKRRRLEPTMIMGEVTRVVCDMLSAKLLSDEGLTEQEIASRLKMHEYRVKLCLRSGGSSAGLRRLLGLCAEADASLKLSPLGYSALEKLICSL